MSAQTYNPNYGRADQNTTVLGGMDFKNGLGLPDSLTQFSPQKKRIRYNLATNRIQTYNGAGWDSYVASSDFLGGGNILTNIRLGNLALYSNTTGYNNAAYGYNTLYSNTTGSGNIGIGYNALYSSTIGNILTAYGNRAGQDLLSGSRNTFLGGHAGGGFESGSGNIFLTSGTDPSGIVSGDNNTIIGSPTGLPSNTSGMVWLGTTSPAFIKDSAGNVKISGTSFTFNGIPVGIGYEPVRNIKTDVTASSSLTGTTGETILKSYEITAGTLSAGMLDVDIAFSKTGTANTVVWKLYKNTSNSLSGATQIATYTGMAAIASAFFHREYSLRGTGIYGYNFNGNLLSDDTGTSSAAISGAAFNTATGNYFIIAAALTDASDAAAVSTFKLTFSASN